MYNFCIWFFVEFLGNHETDFQTVFFFWKLRPICRFWVQNHFCAILGRWDICKTKWGSETDKVKLGMTWSDLSSVRLTSKCPDWHLTGPVNPWGTSLGNFRPLRASRPVSGQLGHLRAIPVLWGPLQVNMNMNLCISESIFVLQISQPPKITQKWFCTQNLHMDLSFQKKKTD